MKRKPIITAADLFCGAGGTSTGLKLACDELGFRLNLLEINHWDTAIETHTTNHPNAAHLCMNVDQVDPRKAVRSGKLDLLIASPECTHHSIARGGKPINDQSRATLTRWAKLRRDSFIPRIVLPKLSIDNDGNLCYNLSIVLLLPTR